MKIKTESFSPETVKRIIFNAIKDSCPELTEKEKQIFTERVFVFAERIITFFKNNSRAGVCIYPEKYIVRSSFLFFVDFLKNNENKIPNFASDIPLLIAMELFDEFYRKGAVSIKTVNLQVFLKRARDKMNMAYLEKQKRVCDIKHKTEYKSSDGLYGLVKLKDLDELEVIGNMLGHCYRSGVQKRDYCIGLRATPLYTIFDLKTNKPVCTLAYNISTNNIIDIRIVCNQSISIWEEEYFFVQDFIKYIYSFYKTK